MPDTINLVGIKASGRHGVLPAEKITAQDFLVDITLEVDLGPAASSDDLKDTVDYGGLAQRAHDLVVSTSYDLIETLADKLATMALGDRIVRSATITVHKPQAPIEVPFDDVSVTVRRER